MQPKNNTSAIERVDALIAHIGISQAAFARRCGVEPSNLNKRLSGEVKFTDNYFAKIAHAFNVNFEWLRNGIGEMFAEEKAIGKAQFAAFNRITAEKDYRIYPDFGHEGMKGQDDDRFRFLLEMR